MAFTNQITIGPEFFAKAKNDYADYDWAITREFMQNSMDCGSTKIDVDITMKDANTILVITNNGNTMTKDVLVNKLLALGGTGKGFEGTVGGFGKAKEIIYFCHNSYKIETGNILVTGSGAGYDLIETEAHIGGTKSTIEIAGDRVDELTRSFKRFCAYAQWPGTVTINGDEFDCSLKKGSPRRNLGFGQIYTNNSYSNKLVVRVNGIPMFHDYIDYKKCVVLELDGKSVETLTSNRDSLVYSHRRELSSFVLELATNKKKALKNANPTYRHFDGAKFKHLVQSVMNVKSLVGTKEGMTARERFEGTLAAFVGGSVGVGSSSGSAVLSGDRVGVLPEMRMAGATVMVETEEVVSVREAFVVKNETDMSIPAYYMPDSAQFSGYGKKLARIWGRLIIELHKLFNHEAEFSIGFVFDEDSAAQFEDWNYGVVYYLNPATVVRQKSSESKSFKKAFKLTERDRLLAIAVHEFVHGLGIMNHSEEYAVKLTEVFGVVLRERKRFNWCYNS